MICTMLQTSDNENISLEFKGHVRDKTSLNESKLTRGLVVWNAEINKITLSLIKNTACTARSRLVQWFISGGMSLIFNKT